MENEENVQVEDVQPESETKPEKTHEFKLGSVIVVSVGVICLAVIIWFAFTIWTGTEEVEVQQPVDQQQAAEEQEYLDQQRAAEEEKNSELGYKNALRFTASENNKFVYSHPDSGKTLYYLKEGLCESDCLDSWEPYMAAEEAEEDFVSMIDGQYALNGDLLYMYKNEEPGDISGGDYSNNWLVAKPE